MRLKPDYERTVTGYVWSDWLIEPWMRWTTRRSQRKLWRLLGDGDAEAGRELLLEALDMLRHDEPE